SLQFLYQEPSMKRVISRVGLGLFLASTGLDASTSEYSRTTGYAASPFETGKTMATISDAQNGTSGRGSFSMQYGTKTSLIASQNNGVSTTAGSIETITTGSTGLVNNANMSESVVISTAGCTGGKIKLISTGFTAD